MVYTLPNDAVFTYHDNSNLMGRKLGLRVRQPHGLAKDVGAAGFFGVEARSSGFGGAAANATMYVAEKMHLAPFSAVSPFKVKPHGRASWRAPVFGP